MKKSLRLRIFCIILLMVFTFQCIWAVAAPQTPQPAAFTDLQQAGGTLLRAGLEAADSWEGHERTRRRHQVLRSVLGVAAFMFIPLGPVATQGQAAMTVFSHAVITLLPSVGGMKMIHQETYLAIENAGGLRGWYITKTVAIAPQETLETVKAVKDPSRRSRMLGAVLASSALVAPQLAEPTSSELVAALQQSTSEGDNLKTAALVLRACEDLGVDHPAVTNCLTYLKQVLSTDTLRGASEEALLAANAYAYFRPAEASRLAAVCEKPQDRCGLLISAADGALRWGDPTTATSLVDRALNEVNAIANLNERISGMASIAACRAAADKREELIKRALAAAQTAGSQQERMTLTRAISLKLAQVDLDAALSVLNPADQPIPEVRFARDLAEAALSAPPCAAHLTLVRILPRKRELTVAFQQLASVLAQSEDPTVRTAAAEAAQASLEVGPERGSNDSIEQTMRSEAISLTALTILASLNPDAAVSGLPDRMKKKYPTLFASSQLRLAGVFAKKALSASEEPIKQLLTTASLEQLRGGFASAPEWIKRKSYYFYLPEVGPAIAAVYRVAPEETLAIATQAPAGAVKAEALLQCSLAQTLAEQPGGRDTLDLALAEAGKIRGETKDVMVSRIAAVMSLINQRQSSQLLDRVKATVWARAAALAMIAGFQRENPDSTWLDALANASNAASAEGFAEERVKAVNWVLNVAITQPGEFIESVRCNGLPWLSP